MSETKVQEEASLFDDAEEAHVGKSKKKTTTTPAKKRKPVEDDVDENKKKREPKKSKDVPKTTEQDDEKNDEQHHDSVIDDIQDDEKNFKIPQQIVPAPSGKDFVVTIPHPQAFKNLVEIMGHVLQDCHFTIIATPSFCGLCVNSYDDRNCCMIIARFACDTRVHGAAAHHFCVKMPIINALLKSVAPRQCLEISRSSGQSQVQMVAYDSHDQARYQEFVLDTLDREPEEDVLDKFNSDYTVEIQLNEFRGLVKMAKDLKAEDLTFEILEPKETGTLRCSYLVLSIDGDAKCRNVYTSLTEWNSSSDPAASSVVIRTAEQTAGNHRRMPARALLMSCLEERFSINYLTNFMASMKRDMLTIRLSSKGEPMVLFHPLGGDSHVSFVLAPRQKQDPAAAAADRDITAE
jgi:hypothetical protein